MLPTTNILRRVYQLRSGEMLASCFTIEVNGRQYLVTAAHCLPERVGTREIQLFSGREWATYGCRVISWTEVPDIAVLVLEVFLGPAYPCEPTTRGLVLGQDVYFLGFPYGLRADGPDPNDFPLPLVKKAALARFNTRDEEDTLILDGINNSGFSGGPVAFFPIERPRDVQIAGVVSAYRVNEIAVHIANVPIDAVVRENTGLVVVYAINRAVAAATESSAGVPVPAG